MSKLVIFDFDGVLCDSFEHVYEINRLAIEQINNTLNKEQYKNLFYGPFHKNLLALLDLDEKKQQKFLDYKYQIYTDIYKKSKLFDSVIPMIHTLSEKKIMLAIISSAWEESIIEKLKENGIFDKFFFIAGMNKLGKIENIERCIKESGVRLNESFFVTDTVGDLKEAKSVGTKTIAVTWGFHTPEELKTEGSDFIVDNPSGITNIFV